MDSKTEENEHTHKPKQNSDLTEKYFSKKTITIEINIVLPDLKETRIFQLPENFTMDEIKRALGIYLKTNPDDFILFVDDVPQPDDFFKLGDLANKSLDLKHVNYQEESRQSQNQQLIKHEIIDNEVLQQLAKEAPDFSKLNYIIKEIQHNTDYPNEHALESLPQETPNEHALESLPQETALSFEQIRIKVRTEFINNENSFLKILKIINEVYCDPLEKTDIIKKGELDFFLSDLKPLYENQKSFVQFLQYLHNTGQDICRFVSYRINEMQASFYFFRKFAFIQKFMKNLRKQNHGFDSFLKERDYTKTTLHQSLEDLLLRINQHLAKVLMLFNRFLETTEQEHPEYQEISNLLGQYTNFMDNLNIEQQKFENQEKLKELQNKFPKLHSTTSTGTRFLPARDDHYVDLKKPGRMFKKEGELIDFESKKTYKFILCNDLLVQTRISKPNKNQVILIRAVLCLQKAEVSAFHYKDYKFGIVLITNMPTHHVYHFSAATRNEQVEWIDLLKESISALKERSLENSLTKYS